MGLLIQEEAIEHVRKVAERERAPMYVVGETTGDHRFAFQQADGVRPFDLAVEQMFGSSPKTYMVDKTVERHYEMPEYELSQLHEYLTNVLQLEAVACKDWLTNKVDRSVTGKIARQQCQGELQLPLSDCGVVALDYRGEKGIATSFGTCSAGSPCRPGSGFYPLRQRSCDQPDLGSACRRSGQRVPVSQLDVAVPLARGRGRTSLYGGKGIERLTAAPCKSMFPQVRTLCP